MGKFLHSRRDIIEIAKRALTKGARQTSLNSIEWDIAGDCTAPTDLTLWGRSLDTESSVSMSRFNIDMQHRCRRCENCLRHRRNLWAMRSATEIALAPRTWFVTLTISPSNRYLLRLRRPDWEDEFEAIHKGASGELTLFLKRVRQRYARAIAKHNRAARKSGGTVAPVSSRENRLRYLLVAEAHEDGTPHYHLFIHQTGVFPLRYRKVLGTKQDPTWTLGEITEAKLVDNSNPAIKWYVAKYLAKDARARVRASGGYGSTASALGLQPVNE